MAGTLIDNTIDAVTLALSRGFDEEMFPAFEGEGTPSLDFWNDEEAPGTVNPRRYWLGGEIDAIPELTQATRVERAIQGGNFQMADVVASADKGTNYGDIKNWMGRYDNGEIPIGSMMAIGNAHYSGKSTHYFRPDAGQMFKMMRRDAKKDGVNITLTDSYRSLAGQHAAKAAKGSLAATPGTSNHGWGMAIDAAEGRDWIRDNGRRYGWIRPSWASDSYEPWHFEFIGSDKAKLDAFNEPKKKKPPEKFTRRYRAQPPSDAYEGTAPEFNPLVAIPNAMVELFSDSPSAPKVKPRRRGNVGDAAGGKMPEFVPGWARPMVRAAASRYGVSPRLIAAVGKVESGWSKNIGLTSSAGAGGPMQIMPLWEGNTPHNIHTLRGNIMAGAFILNRYIKGAGGDLRKGLASYNAGPANWQAGLGYADTVLGILRGK